MDNSQANARFLNPEISEPTFDLSLNLLSTIFLSLFLIGLFTTLLWLIQLFAFIHLHCIHSSKLSRYQRPGAWALVTGSSQGIGEGFARALAGRGFNVVLHGRNEPKLKTLVSQLEAQHPRVSFKYVIADAASSHGMKQAIQRIVDEVTILPGPLTILVNNIGAMHGVYGHRSPIIAIHNATPADVDATLNINVRFTIQLTRAVLPVLAGGASNAKRGPAKPEPFLILNLSSLASGFGTPFLSVYGASKSFINKWSSGVAQEFEMQPQFSEAECLCLVSGEVAGAGGLDVKPSLSLPSTETFVKAALNKVGCGRLSVRPWIVHDLIAIWSFETFPEWVLKLMMRFAMSKESKYWRDREFRLQKDQ